VQQLCSRCEGEEDGADCVLCGRRKHSFWQVTVGKVVSYVTEPSPCANKIVAKAYNAKAFDHHLILNWAIMLNCKPELILNGLKIMCMKFEHLVFLDDVSFLPCALRKHLKALSLTARQSWYSHYFNTVENLGYVCPIRDVSYYGVNVMLRGRGGGFSRGTRARSPFLTFDWKFTVRITSQY